MKNIVKKIVAAGVILIILAAITGVLLRNKSEIQKEAEANASITWDVPVETYIVDYKTVLSEKPLRGKLIPGLQIAVKAEISGRVARITKNVGDQVLKGENIAKIIADLVEEQLKAAEETMANAAKMHGRIKTLHEKNAATGQQLEETKLNLEQAQLQVQQIRNQLLKQTITSPLSGVVVERHAEEGALIVPSMPLLTIAAQDAYLFEVGVTEKHLSEYLVGVAVDITLDAFPDQIFHGQVKEVSEAADGAGKYAVKIEFDSRGHLFKQGMSGVLHLKQSGSSVLLLPRRAIIGSIKAAQIFLVQGDTVILRSIDVASLDEKFVVVRNGLNAGDEVVTSGMINLEEGKRVNILNK